MAALGYEYGCIGLRIWLHWVTNMAALGYEYTSVRDNELYLKAL